MNKEFTEPEKDNLSKEWFAVLDEIMASKMDSTQFSPEALMYCFIKHLEKRGYAEKYFHPANYRISISYQGLRRDET